MDSDPDPSPELDADPSAGRYAEMDSDWNPVPGPQARSNWNEKKGAVAPTLDLILVICFPESTGE